MNEILAFLGIGMSLMLVFGCVRGILGWLYGK